MQKPILLSSNEIKQLASDARWSMKGNGPGWMNAVSVHDLCFTIEVLRATNEVVFSEFQDD